MKRRAVWTFSLVLWALIACTLFSLKIEKLMVPKVTTTSPSRETHTMPLDALFTDESGDHLYSVVEGTGWEKGIRAQELVRQGYFPGNYQILEDRIYLESSAAFVHYASKPIREGDLISVEEGKNTAGDHWLAVFPESAPPLDQLSEGVAIEQTSETAYLLAVEEAELPFMEDRARSMSGLSQQEGKFYSLGDLESFLDALPLLAVGLCLLLIPVLLWGYSGLLLDAPKRKAPLLLNGCIGAVSLAGLALLLYFLDLPSSLLPQNAIVEFSHYSREFSQIFQTLEDFASAGSSTAQKALADAGTARTLFLTVLGAGLLLLFPLLFLERRLLTRRGRHTR